MPCLDLEPASGDFGTVAIGDLNPRVAKLERERSAGGGFGQTVGRDRPAQKALGVGGAKGVHAQARASADAGGIAGLGDLALGHAGEVAGVGEHVVAVAGNVGQHVGIEQARDDTLATALGIAPDDLDCFIFKIDVLNPQPGQLVEAQACRHRQAGRELEPRR